MALPGRICEAHAFPRRLPSSERGIPWGGLPAMGISGCNGQLTFAGSPSVSAGRAHPGFPAPGERPASGVCKRQSPCCPGGGSSARAGEPGEGLEEAVLCIRRTVCRSRYPGAGPSRSGEPQEEGLGPFYSTLSLLETQQVSLPFREHSLRTEKEKGF